MDVEVETSETQGSGDDAVKNRADSHTASPQIHADERLQGIAPILVLAHNLDRTQVRVGMSTILCLQSTRSPSIRFSLDRPVLLIYRVS